jgi:hypothetical protein
LPVESDALGWNEYAVPTPAHQKIFDLSGLLGGCFIAMYREYQICHDDG